MLKKIKNFLWPEKEKEEIPEAWAKGRIVKKAGEDVPTLEVKVKEVGTQKIRVPFLRTLKKVLGGIMLIFSFWAAIATFNSIPIFLMFALYFFLLLDYLWKMREPRDERWIDVNHR